MASALVTRRYAASVAFASLLLLLATAFAAAATGGEPDGPDAAAGDSPRAMLDCTMRCVTDAMGCATRCAGARADEAPVCAAACVQGDIRCLAGYGGGPRPSPLSPSPPAA
ncbi:hypothetical protein BS78_06G076300 [Paspalum vaginatum]|nr:hypothetical protein BS78_06G076300 [Paspalum vaginatum]